MKYTIWGGEFDYLPIRYISALTTDLVMRKNRKRSNQANPATFAVPLGDNFIVSARVSQADNEGVSGSANIFKIEDLAARSDSKFVEAYRPTAHISFALDDPTDWCAEELLISSSLLLQDEADADGLLSALIVASDASLR